jgi:hypothetical protein
MFEAPTVQRQSRLTAALEEAAHAGADIDRRLDRLEAVILETLPQAAADDRKVRALFPAVAPGPWTPARLKTLQRELDRVVGPLPYSDKELQNKHPQEALLRAVSTVACLVGKKQQLRALQSRVVQRAEAMLKLLREPTEDNKTMVVAQHKQLEEERKGKLVATDVGQEALMRGHRNRGAINVTRPFMRQNECPAFQPGGSLEAYEREIQRQKGVWISVFGNTFDPHRDRLLKLVREAVSKVTLYDPSKAAAVGFQPMLVDQESGEELTTLGQLAQFVMKGLGVVRFTAVEPRPGAPAPVPVAPPPPPPPPPPPSGPPPMGPIPPPPPPPPPSTGGAAGAVPPPTGTVPPSPPPPTGTVPPLPPTGPTDVDTIRKTWVPEASVPNVYVHNKSTVKLPIGTEDLEVISIVALGSMENVEALATELKKKGYDANVNNFYGSKWKVSVHSLPSRRITMSDYSKTLLPLALQFIDNGKVLDVNYVPKR